MKPCPMCGTPSLFADSPFCVAHDMAFTILRNKVERCDPDATDWPRASYFTHPVIQTSECMRLKSQPSWRDTVQRINDRASWWLPGNQSHESGDAA